MVRPRLTYLLVAALMGPPCFFILNLIPEGNMNLEPTTAAELRALEPSTPIEVIIADIQDPVALLVIERLQKEMEEAHDQLLETCKKVLEVAL